MAVITGTGTTLGLELEISGGAPALFVEYKRLGTGMDNGEVSSPVRTVDLVVPQVEGAALVTRVVTWIGEVRANQSIVTSSLADLPLELDSAPIPLVTPTGIHYEIKMGSLIIEIDWDKVTDEVTIHAGPAFTVSLEGFMYYVDTLVDLIKTIELVKAAG